jgi:hypothetical protein
MMGRKAVLVMCGVLAWVTVAALPASAEWMLDVYVGANITQKADVDIRPGSTRREVRYDSSGTYGGRIGYWFEGLPWLGVSMDVSLFKPVDDVTIIPLSALLMLRWPLLPSEAVPDGQLQPYLAVGPGAFVAHLDGATHFSPALPSTFTDTSVEPGLDLRAGLAWQFHRRFAVLGEYRFTHVRPHFQDNIPVAGTTLDTTFNTHHFILGISFRY